MAFFCVQHVSESLGKLLYYNPEPTFSNTRCGKLHTQDLINIYYTLYIVTEEIKRSLFYVAKVQLYKKKVQFV